MNHWLINYFELLEQNDFDIYILGEYELLKISKNNINMFDIYDENNVIPINKRPKYNGGSPDYTHIFSKNNLDPKI